MKYTIDYGEKRCTERLQNPRLSLNFYNVYKIRIVYEYKSKGEFVQCLPI